jgi:hypothetical protein
MKEHFHLCPSCQETKSCSKADCQHAPEAFNEKAGAYGDALLCDGCMNKELEALRQQNRELLERDMRHRSEVAGWMTRVSAAQHAHNPGMRPPCVKGCSVCASLWCPKGNPRHYSAEGCPECHTEEGACGTFERVIENPRTDMQQARLTVAVRLLDMPEVKAKIEQLEEIIHGYDARCTAIKDALKAAGIGDLRLKPGQQMVSDDGTLKGTACGVVISETERVQHLAAQRDELLRCVQAAIEVLGGVATKPLTHALINAVHAAAAKLRIGIGHESSTCPRTGAEMIGLRLIGWLGQAMGRAPTAEDVDRFRVALDGSTVKDAVSDIASQFSESVESTQPPREFIARYHAIKAGHFDRIAQLVGKDGEPLDESVARVVKERDEAKDKLLLIEQELSQAHGDAAAAYDRASIAEADARQAKTDFDAANDCRLRAETEFAKIYARCASLTAAADAGARHEKELIFLHNRIDDAEGVVNQIMVAIDLFGADASGIPSQRLVAHLRQVLEDVQQTIGNRDASEKKLCDRIEFVESEIKRQNGSLARAEELVNSLNGQLGARVRELMECTKERDTLKRGLDKAVIELDAAVIESARRYDCCGGPGTTEPACRACVTCLLRDLEEVKKVHAALTVDQREAIEFLVDHFQEWKFEDNPEGNVCEVCGWDSRESQSLGLSHKPGCKTPSALAVARALVADAAEHEEKDAALRDKQALKSGDLS